MPWKERQCVIWLPYGSPEQFGGLKPRSGDELRQQMNAWEMAGFDVSGYDLGHAGDSGLNGVSEQSRYLEAQQLFSVNESARHIVHIPNPKAWQDYVDWLTEEKLRALGVGGLDEPPATVTREADLQGGARTFSPSLNPVMAIQPGFPPSQRSTPGLSSFSTGTHSRTMSIASPLSSGSEFRGHAHRHSVFGVAQTYSQLPGLNPSLRSFSPSQQLSLNAIARASSPGLDRIKNNDSPVPRVASPLDGQNARPSPLSGERRWTPPPSHSGHQSLAPSTSPQPLLVGAAPRKQLEEVPETEEDSTHHFTPQGKDIRSQIVVPTPRSHRHNISHNLEMESRQAEQSLEQPQNDANAAAPSFPSPSIMTSISMPQSDSFSFKSAQYGSDLPAFSFGGQANVQMPFQTQFFGTHPSGAFVQTPTEIPLFPFQPNPHAFNFSPTLPGPYETSAQRGSARASGTNQSLRGKAPMEFNVTAPSFKPQKLAQASSVPSSSFDFSSAHAFKPEASAFQPSQATGTTRETSSIFGDIQILDLAKPARRSKAVEIVRPASSRMEEQAEEDESGRLVQSSDRQKRAFRQADNEGDTVPLFAVQPDSPIRNSTASIVEIVEDKAIEETVGGSQSEADSGPAEAEQRDDSLLEAESTTKAPSGTVEPVEESYTDDPLLDLDENIDIGPSWSDGPTVRTHRHARNPSSLSALAKPFTFSPSSHASQEPALQLPSFEFRAAPWKSLVLDPEHPDFDPGRIFSRDTLVQDEASLSVGLNNASHAPPQDMTMARLAETSLEPSFDELDAVMRQLNDEEGATEAFKESEEDLQLVDNFEDSAIASRVSSPRSVQIHAISEEISRSPSPLPVEFVMDTRRNGAQVPNNSNLKPSSEWSDDYASGIANRRSQSPKFSKESLKQVIENAFKIHVKPLQQQVDGLQQLLSKTGHDNPTQSRRIVSSGMESDADDEDDVMDSKYLPQPVPQGRSRKYELIKSVVLDALSSQALTSPDTVNRASFMDGIASMNSRLDALLVKEFDPTLLQAMIEEGLLKTEAALFQHLQFNPPSNEQAEKSDSMRSMLNLEEELDALRADNTDKDQKIFALNQERQGIQARFEEFELSEARLQREMDGFAAENTAQKLTLDEYRISHAQWREDQENASAEKERLQANISELEERIADGHDVRDNMREKLDRIHRDMATAAEQLANQKVAWQRQTEDLQRQCAVFQARLDSESQLRSGLENELSRLRILALEGDSAKVQLEQSVRNNAVLEEAIQSLRDEVTDRQTSNSRVHRELQDARENSRIEVQRAQLMMQAAVESANSKADATQAGLESKLSIMTNEVENVKALMESMKARHDVLLQEEADLRRDTLLKVNEASNAALEHLKTRHDEDIQYLKTQHGRALHEEQQEKSRSEFFWNERLSLSDARHSLLQERIGHLEERLEIAKSAAHAAASAAQAAKAIPKAAAAGMPDRISPQALRESILVLQEQLQEREGRIEQMQAVLSDRESDSDLPNKLKEKDIEISWLRELLAVRSEDLNELIENLSQQDFDRRAAKDTAIRIRTALQMEQAEKERHIAAGSSLSAQAMAGLTNFASPRAAQLAAAIGSWRARGTPSGPTPSSLRNAQKTHQTRSGTTPSKRPPSSSSWMSGLMTPPASNLRRTPSPHSPSVESQVHVPKRPDSRGNLTSSQATQKRSNVSTAIVPETPEDTPLSFRRASYDEDAELGSLSPRIDDDFDGLDIASPHPISQLKTRSLAAELEPLG